MPHARPIYFQAETGAAAPVQQTPDQAAAVDGRGAFAPARVNVTSERVLRVLGYPAGRQIRPAVLNAAESMAEVANRVGTPEVRYRRLAIERIDDDGTLRLAGGVQFRSQAFNAHLAGAGDVVLFVLTLGKGLDLVSANLNAAGNLMEAVMLESAAWMAIEHATKDFARFLVAQVADEELALTRRMAPGYGFHIGGQRLEWPLEQQAELFAALGPGPLPVQVLESGAMTPKMSRSGLWGLRRRDA
jgi:hypothetical protein